MTLINLWKPQPVSFEIVIIGPDMCPHFMDIIVAIAISRQPFKLSNALFILVPSIGYFVVWVIELSMRTTRQFTN